MEEASFFFVFLCNSRGRLPARPCAHTTRACCKQPVLHTLRTLMAKRSRGDAAAAPVKTKRRRSPPADAASTYALAVSVDGDAPWPPYVYVKRHAEPGEATPRAAFVTGLPPAWRPLDDVLRAVFGAVGDVDAVVLHKDQVRVSGEGERKGGRTC